MKNRHLIALYEIASSIVYLTEISNGEIFMRQNQNSFNGKCSKFFNPAYILSKQGYVL